jgi:hypothetical protein
VDGLKSKDTATCVPTVGLHRRKQRGCRDFDARRTSSLHALAATPQVGQTKKKPVLAVNAKDRQSLLQV